MLSRRTVFWAGAVAVIVVLLFLARQQPSLRVWVQLMATILVSGGLYWYGWDGHTDARRYRSYWRAAGPTWLTLVCARPEERLVIDLALLQVGSMGFGVGSILGFALSPGEMLFYGVLALLGVASVTVLSWGAWGVWRLLVGRKR